LSSIKIHKKAKLVDVGDLLVTQVDLWFDKTSSTSPYTLFPLQLGSLSSPVPKGSIALCVGLAVDSEVFNATSMELEPLLVPLLLIDNAVFLYISMKNAGCTDVFKRLERVDL
jgi:hypothetical protein